MTTTIYYNFTAGLKSPSSTKETSSSNSVGAAADKLSEILSYPYTKVKKEVTTENEKEIGKEKL